MLLKIKDSPRSISDPKDVAHIFRSILLLEDEIDRDKEHFWSIGLNTKHMVLYVELVSLGSLNNSIVHPREVFRMAILKAAANIIIGHNHPSGDPEASFEDKEITRRLIQAGDILGIKVLDHVIIANGKTNYVSLDDIMHFSGGDRRGFTIIRESCSIPSAERVNASKSIKEASATPFGSLGQGILSFAPGAIQTISTFGEEIR